MSSLKHRKRRSPKNLKMYRLSLSRWFGRVTRGINPFLAMIAIGLLLLNITIYVERAVSHETFIWAGPHQAVDNNRLSDGRVPRR